MVAPSRHTHRNSVASRPQGMRALIAAKEALMMMSRGSEKDKCGQIHVPSNGIVKISHVPSTVQPFTTSHSFDQKERNKAPSVSTHLSCKAFYY
jgi:hypothetical protein